MPNFQFLSLFLLSLSFVFLLRHQPSISNYSLTSSTSPRLLTSQSFKQRACQNTDLTGYLSSISDKESVQFAYDMVKTSRNNENKLKSLIQNKTSISTDDSKAYGMSLLKAAIPIAILFILAFFGFWVYCSCLCCKCCNCFKKKQLTPLDINCPGIFAFIMALGVIGSAIAALIINEKFHIGYNRVQCSVATSLDDLLLGTNTTSENLTYMFLGMTGADEKMQLILNSFTETVGYLESNFQDTAWIDEDKTQLRSHIRIIKT